MDTIDACSRLLQTALSVQPGERVLVVADEATTDVGNAIYEAAKRLRTVPAIICYPPSGVAGTEPPGAVADAMLAADVVVCATTDSITHTKAKANAVKAGARVATMPGITKEMLESGALTADFGIVEAFTKKIADLLTDARSARIIKDDYELALDLSGRMGVASTGVLRKKSTSANVPSGKAFIAPNEHDSNGSILIDGAVTGLGLVSSPLVMKVSNGLLTEVSGEDARKLEILVLRPENATLCEFGIGTNYAARLTGNPLEDDKAYHTAHIAFGTNTSFGGVNKADCHIDCIVKNPTIYLDSLMVMDHGIFTV